ncbi:MAG: SusD/RagB family nutrient-binding outer membrane lipoprotein [Flavipsychrobacter sp.]
MSIKKAFIIATTIGITIASSSCKKYLDVNKNPNVADTVTPNLLLPSAEVYIGSAMGVNMQIFGSIWAQYWTQNPNSSQYRTAENYQPNSNDFDYPWNLFYSSAGEDLVRLQQIAASQSKKQYQAIALLLQAYEFQVITDAWGDVPYTEALKGLQSQGHITNPHYDAQKVVYNGILSMINQAQGLIDPSDPTVPGGDDLIYGGDMTKWKKFANTLQLRVLLRLAYKDPATAQAGIAALYATSPSFLDKNEDAQINYTSTAGNKNPLYSEAAVLNYTQNVVASQTCIDSMNSNNDYRLAAFYYPGSTGFVGIRQGNYNQLVSAGTYAVPSSYVGANFQDANSATAPVKLLTGYESKFLQAEAVVRGWASGDAQQLFIDGITANFLDNTWVSSYNDIFGVTADYALNSYLNGDTSAGVPPAYWGQFPTGGTMEQKLRHIITQKWFCMCGNEGFEAWTEWRRTGYPDFFVVSTTNLTGGKFPRRFLYPFAEVTENANFPGIIPVTTPVWWDIH